MHPKVIDSEQFIARVRPALAARDPEQLARLVRAHWTIEQLCDLLNQGQADARKVACLVLGLVGCPNCVPCLSAALHDDDPIVAELAEHAMWSIWFRSASPDAVEPFKLGLELMEAHQYARALEALTEAIELDEEFAEAYNQRAIAHYMLDQWDAALADCERTVDLVPYHFGALAGMGHCFAHAGDLPEAARCYREALAVNPRMSAIARALAKIEHRMNVHA